MDWDAAYDTAKGFAYATQGLTDINNMRRQNNLYRQNQEDRAEEKRFQSNVDANMGVLSSSMDKGRQKSAMVGTHTAQAEARRRHAVDLSNQETIRNDAKEKKINQAYKHILSDLSKNGRNFQQDRGDYDVDIYNEALNKATTAYTKTEQGKAILAETRKAAHAKNWETFSKYQTAIMASDQSGDKQRTVNLVEQMTVDAPMPYSLKWNEQEQGFDKLFRHSGTDTWKKTGTVSMDQAIKLINTTGRRQFAIMEFTAKEATRQWNNDAWLPAGQEGANGQTGRTQIFKKDGKAYHITPQKNPDRPNSVLYYVTADDNTQQVFQSQADLMKAGFRFEDLARENDLASLETRKALKGKYDAQAMAAGHKKESASRKASLDFYSKQLKESLAPFKTGSGGLGMSFNEAGEPVFKDGGAAFTKSQEFFHDHKYDWQKLGPQDQTKFHGAATADALYKTMLTIGREAPKPAQTAPGGDGAPVQAKAMSLDEIRTAGGRRDKGGNWYVPAGKGKWQKVTTLPADELKASHEVGRAAMGGSESVADPADTTPGEQPARQTPGQEKAGNPATADLPPDPKEWQVRYVNTALNKGKYVIADTNGNERDMTDEEMQSYLAAIKGPQGDVYDPLAAMNRAVNDFHNYQRQTASGGQSAPRTAQK